MARQEARGKSEEGLGDFTFRYTDWFYCVHILRLRPGDVIKSMNNQPVLKVDEVQKIVENSKIGIPLQVKVERNGKISQFLVKPAPLPVNKE